MRVVFMGTPDYAVPALAELIASGHEVVCVYSQPPRPRGRGHKLHPSPVHAFAEAHGIPVRTPTSLKKPDAQDAFANLRAEVGIVVAYGLILPQAILDAPDYGCLNLHGSLLPRWRGAAPIQRAIMAGDAVTGVQLMQMEAGLDTGPVLLSETVPIEPSETYGSLHDKLSRTGADLLPRGLAALERGGLTRVPQSEDGVTYAHKITAEEARIDWSRPAAEVDAHIRGLSPFPGAWTEDARGTRLKLLLSRIGSDTNEAAGTVLAKVGALGVACGDGRTVELVRLQRPGGRPQASEEFLRGYDLPPGSVLT
ncbi:methionyl-tRNA formyltransferase [Parvularcula dongshanensis]|uniref:Methionyl-tRNA formyltransferase n=1 Tax=Parvularcula dongshanensis TaxID=1173995 RepID=A0A840I0Q8_9PROT|nr:methionyl-tRNA formyltransferase [Parvularcula dongshanensis]MBB4658307.1 methionyl-tRNA formyltransferase [Parvularcula dongshanensis]